MPTIAITGASGFVGSALAARFTAKGWTTIGLARHPAGTFEYRRYDLRDPICPPDLLRGADVLVHAAYVKRVAGVDALAVNLAGARNLMAAATVAGVSHRVFLSSLSARPEAVSDYGRQKLAIEELFLAEGGAAIRAGLVLGSGGVFGPLRDHILARLPIPLFGGGHQPVQTVHIDDLLAALEVVVAGRLQGRFVVAEPKPLSYRQFCQALADAAGIPARFVSVPFWFARLGVQIGELLRLSLPVTRDNLLGLQSAAAVESAADLERLGVRVRNCHESLQDLMARLTGDTGHPERQDR